MKGSDMIFIFLMTVSLGTAIVAAINNHTAAQQQIHYEQIVLHFEKGELPKESPVVQQALANIQEQQDVKKMVMSTLWLGLSYHSF